MRPVRHRLRVLIVDDEPLVRAFIADALRESAEVCEAGDVNDAMAELSRSGSPPFDLVLIDCVLPNAGRAAGHAGVELVKTVRARWPWISTVAITGRAESEALAIEAFRSGARDFLKKPFTLGELAAAVARATPARLRRRSADGSQSGIAIQRVVGFLGEHYTEPLTLETVAKIAAMSRSHFCRMFRAVTGKPFRDYVRDLRFARAQELLLRSNLSLTAIAVEVGFYDLPHFNKAFRKRFGISPAAFVRRKPPTAMADLPPAWSDDAPDAAAQA